LTGKERFSLKLNEGNLEVGGDITVSSDCGKTFTAKIRLDTPVEVEYYKNGGIL
jgi:aconitate hydratase